MIIIAGQQFDKDGIRRQWWEASSTMTFRERQTCFVDQYNQFTNQGHNVGVIVKDVYYACMIM